tara:strand:+ start:1975 stop:3753 length:1779 start_codon:yes stop_codon:yes gene_type:complete
LQGYNNKYLLINLNNHTSEEKPLDGEILANYIGGTGLSTYLLYKYSSPKVDSLAPQNPLVFASSPLTGTKLTTTSKFSIATKSPITDFIGDSMSSSHFSDKLKKTGFDALVIIGKSNKKELIKISNSDINFIDASKLWGKHTSETELILNKKIGNNYSYATIGPAGENLVRFAGIKNDGGRMAARTGVGAVMGSKNIKAIAVGGDINISISEPQKINEIRKKLSKKSLGESTEKYRTTGTTINMSLLNRLEMLPTNNFSESIFKKSEKIEGENLIKNHFSEKAHCANCTIGCEKIFVTNDKNAKIKSRLEFQTTASLGSNIGVSNPNWVIRAARLCDELGMDTISTGVTIGWAIEASKNGHLKHNIDISSESKLLKLIKDIAYRKSIGNLLAEGSKLASDITGKNSNLYAMHVKGLEIPSYDPRNLPALALALSVSTKGACHNRASAYDIDFNNKQIFEDPTLIAKKTKESEDLSAVIDSMIWCKFLRKSFDDLYAESSDIYSLITGERFTENHIKIAGERINNLKKLFNIKNGWSRIDDNLPKRLLESNNKKNQIISKNFLDSMISNYYHFREWDKNGNIPNNKLKSLNIS